MSEQALSWDELDQLADYVAGALDGVEADRVAELIRTDERWGTAHAQLVAAEPVVQAALQSAAQVVPPMPDDVADRIDAFLAAPPARTTRSARTRRLARSARRRPVEVERSRRSAPMLTRVAAAVLAVVAAGGVAVVARGLLTQSAGFSSADSAPDVLAEVPPAAAPSAVEDAGADIDNIPGTLLIASGTDYRRETLNQIADEPKIATAEALDSYLSAERFADRAEFAKLADADQLRECLDAVARAHSGTVTVADFAEFEGEPAVVLLVDQGRTSMAVAVGPDCSAADTDELATALIE